MKANDLFPDKDERDEVRAILDMFSEENPFRWHPVNNPHPAFITKVTDSEGKVLYER